MSKSKRSGRASEASTDQASTVFFERMEPRILLSADALGGLAPADPCSDNDTAREQMNAGDSANYLLEAYGAKQSGSEDNEPTGIDQSSFFDTLQAAFDESNTSGDTADSLDTLGDMLDSSETENRREIIFVDAATPDYQQLLGTVNTDRPGTDYQVFILQSGRDGVEQISEILGGFGAVDAIHLVSHGNQSGLQLGSAWLDASTMDAYAESLRSWSGALADGADILLYGCNLAADEQGRMLIETLGAKTGADIAASTDLTGHASLGGDWELEYRSGTVETAVFSASAFQTWNGTLAAFIVDSTADTADANPGDGVAEDASGNTTLRAAIMEANALGGADTIYLSDGNYTLTQFGFGDGEGDLDIRSDLSIIGESATGTVIDGNNGYRVFEVHDDAAITVTFENLKIADGSTGAGGPDGAGLLINGSGNQPDVYLSNVWFSSNDASGGGGGAIYNEGNLTVTDSLIEGNTATNGGGIAHAGGTLTLSSVTVSGNTAINAGGGLYNQADATITNSTFTLNGANDGGGIRVQSGTVSVANTISAGNTATSGHNDILGVFTSLGHNLIGDDTGSASFVDGVNGDQVGTNVSPLDPMLGGLTNNGGELMTHALLGGSPAIDAADRSDMSTTDARGFLRGDGSPDIGAYEDGATAATTATYLDQFNNIAYDGDNGTLPWSTDWQEVGTTEPGGPVTESIKVVSDQGGALHFGGSQLEVGDYIWREADLSGATSVILSFDYKRQDGKAQTAAVDLEIRADASSPWEFLANFDQEPFTYTQYSVDISQYATASTQIRFITTIRDTDYLNFDNVQIELSTPAPATTTLTPVKDTYISSGNPTDNYGSNTTLLLDESGAGLGNGHVLMEFNLASIPSGATITSAVLQMEAIGKSGAAADSSLIKVFEVTEAWSEGSGGSNNDATWNERQTSTAWATAGGTINGTEVASLTTSGTGGHGWDITDLVQDWVSGSKINNGLMLAGDDPGTVLYTYGSSESGTPPQLVITYSGGSVTNNAPVAQDDSYSTNEDVNLVVGAGNDLLDNDTDGDGDTLTAEVTDGPDNGMLVFDPVGLGKETNLTNDGAFDHHGRWSPDGSKIAFTSERGAGGDRDIYVMNADGTGVTALTTDGTFSDEQPVWSPDGSMLAIASNRDGDNEIFIIDSNDGSIIRQLTSDAGADQRPTWSPDGSQIAWTSDRDGNFDIWIANADGSGVPSKLTTDVGDDTQPVWSPDGSKILFVSTRDGNENIYVMDADGSNETQLTNDAGIDRVGSWSPDGSKIFFTSDRAGSLDIWVMDADGSNERLVEAAAGEEYWTEVSADGTTLLTMRDGEIYETPLQFDGTFTYVPDAGFSGTENFSYVANDGVENSNVATATITIDGKPDFVASGPFSVDEGAAAGTVVGDVDANDGDGGAADVGVSYSITGNLDPDGDSRKTFIIDSATGVITVNDADDLNFEDNASLNITVEADDGTNTESTTVTINLNNINDAPSVITPTPVFINEIHYDNVGLDTGEAIEIAGVAGNDLNDWTLVMYNGFDGSVYDTVALSGVLPNQTDNFGTLAFSFPTDGIQNATSGNPDGVALVDPSSNVLQFLSYEGSFTATEGPANGMSSTDIGVAEDNATTAVGESLQLTGAGAAFTWAAAGAETFGTPNTGQDFAALAAASQQMVDEEADLVFSTANGNAIVVGDVDAALSAAADPVSVSLSVSNGTLTLGGTTGLGSIVGNGSGNVTFTGTVAELNAAMEGLTYKAVTDFNGTDTLTVLVDDQGNDGLGGAQTATGTVHIMVNPVDDPLNVNTTGNTVTFTEGAGATTALFSAGIDTIETGDTISEVVLTLANVEAGDTLRFGATSVDLNSNGTTGPDGAGFSYTVSSAGASPVVTISHAGADDATVNTMLNSLLFNNTSNDDPGTTARTVTLASITDSGSGLTMDGTVATVNVAPVNDAPTISTSTYDFGSIDEDTTLAGVQVSTIVSSLAGVDPDGDNVGMAVTAASGNGSWQFSTDSTDGSDGNWTGFGSVAANSALLLSDSSWIRYQPDGDNGENVAIDFHAWDGTTGSASGTGSPSTADPDGGGGIKAFSSNLADASLVVTDLNDAPSAINLTSTSTYNEGDASVDIDDIFVSDVDTMENVGVTLTLNDTTTGSLSSNDGAVYNPGTGEWTIFGTLSSVNNALANMVFNPNINNDQDTTISVEIDDGDEDSSAPLTGTITLDVNPINDPISINTTGNTVTFTEDAGATTALFSAGIDTIEPGDTISEVVLSLANVEAGDTLRFGVTSIDLNSNGITGPDGAGFSYTVSSAGASPVVTISHAGAGDAAVNTMLNSLVFNNTSNDDPGTTARTVTLTSITDSGSGLTMDGTVATVNVAPVNDAPTATIVPAAFGVDEDDGYRLLGGISVSDPDAGSNELAVTLSVNDGVIRLGNVTGLTFTAGSNQSASMTFTGTLTDLNTALGTLAYQPDPNYAGTDTLSLTVDDQGNTGGGALIDTDSVDIVVSPINDAPTTTPVTLAPIGEDSGARTITQAELLANASDIEGDAMTATGLSISAGAGTLVDNGDGTWDYTPALNNDTAVSFSYTISDGSDNTAASANLDITPANDAPAATNTSQGWLYNEGVPALNLLDIVVTDPDNGDTITAILTLADTSTGSLSANDGASYDGLTGIWTITDTVGNVNTALANLVFNPGTNNDINTSISVHIEDAAGAGPADSTIDLDVTPFNDAPTATNLSQVLTYNEGDAVVALNDIVVTEVDTGDTITATLTLANTSTGTLSTNNGATYDGLTGIWTITDTVANVNTALANLVFNPVPANDVDTTITTHIEDALGTGPLDGSIALNVTPINDPPTATNLSSTSSYNEGDATVAIADIVVSDVDSAEVITATLTLSDTATGSLSANDGATYDGFTGIWTISGSLAQVNTALANLVFIPTPTNDVDTSIAVSIDDGDEDGSGALTGTIALDVTPFNTAPTATNLSSTAAYNEGDTAVAITDIVVSDADLGDIVTATLTLADTATGSLSANDGASYDGLSGIWTITDTVANVNTALANLVFNPATNNDLDTSIAVSIDDGDEDGSGALTGSITLDVTPSNDAPSATGLSGTSNYNQGDSSVVLNDIVITDLDSGETVTATLTLLNPASGSLSANDGATYDAVSGVWTITGSVAQVNAALANLEFIPQPDNTLDTAIAVSIDDGDEDGSGPLLGAMNITVNPLPETEPPVVEPPPEDPVEATVEGEVPEPPVEEPVSETTAADLLETPELDPKVVAQIRTPGPVLPAASGVDFEEPVERNNDRENDRETADPKPAGVEILLTRLREQIDFYNDPLQLIGADTFITRLNDMRDELISETRNTEKVVGSSLTVTAGLSVGYVVWLARSGVLLSSALSSLPAWRFIDPLPVLGALQAGKADDDEESLESLVAEDPVDDEKKATAGHEKDDA